MKPINEMSLAEVCTRLEEYAIMTEEYEFAELAHRVTDLTRWIPVEERLPTEQDADKHGFVLVRQVENESPNRVYTHMERWSLILEPDYFYTTTHWRRIDKPEGV